jgi:hypothetical protein
MIVFGSACQVVLSPQNIDEQHTVCVLLRNALWCFAVPFILRYSMFFVKLENLQKLERN